MSSDVPAGAAVVSGSIRVDVGARVLPGAGGVTGAIVAPGVRIAPGAAVTVVEPEFMAGGRVSDGATPIPGQHQGGKRGHMALFYLTLWGGKLCMSSG